MSVPIAGATSPLVAPQHQRLLDASAIALDVAVARGYRTVTMLSDIRALGFAKSCTVPGLLIPVHGADGTVRTHQYRPDQPRLNAKGKPRKYEFPFRSHQALDVPPTVREQLGDPAVPLWITEGARKADAAVSVGLICISLSGVWNWRGTNDAGGKTALPDWESIALNDRRVFICFDSDVTTNPDVERALVRLTAFLEYRGAIVTPVYLPQSATGAKVGLDDYLAADHLVDDLMALTTRPHDHPTASASATLVANQAPAGRTPPKEAAEKPKQGRDVQFEEPDPWPDPVDGAALLDAIAETFTRYLALPADAHSALALWVLHAYAFQAWFTSPFLAITSPVRRCGKTLLLIVLGALVPRRLFASNVTPAVLFRTIEKYGPTLLIDEADTFIRDNEELRGVLNSGHTRTTAVVIRAVGDDHEPRVFSTWCAKVIALIGKLPDTLDDRSIEVRMRRRRSGECVERLRQDRIEAECSDVRRQAARWAADHLQELQDADPHVPAALHDRAADCWRPLLAIADRVGGHWPAAAREAAKALSGVESDGEQPVAILLLDDVKAIFGAATQEVSSGDLVKALWALDSRPWATWGKDDKGLTTHALARLLKDFTIHPVKIRFGADTANGYTRRMFEDAWSRYTSLKPERWNNPNSDGPKSGFSQPEHPKPCSTSENAGSTNNGGLGSTVPLQQAVVQGARSTGADVGKQAAQRCCEGGPLQLRCKLCQASPSYWQREADDHRSRPCGGRG